MIRPLKTALLAFVLGSSALASANLAINKSATGSSTCNSNESANKAFDGKINGLNSKFCSTATEPWVQVDLGSIQTINAFAVAHAGYGGESSRFNTKDYQIRVSQDGINYQTVAMVHNNAADIRATNIVPVSARYVRLWVLTPTQEDGDGITRIYELFVYGRPVKNVYQSVQVFDHLPQFGVYSSTDPNWQPASNILMWKHGTEYARKLSDQEKAMIGSDASVQLAYHAQCDNYDRFGSVFYIKTPKGVVPNENTTRTTLFDFITPFSNAWNGKYANLAYPPQSIAPFSQTLNSANSDIWVGISGGSNPYSGDPCEKRTDITPLQRSIGFLYSLSITSKNAINSNPNHQVLSLMSRVEQKQSNFVTPTLINMPNNNRKNILAISTAGYGAAEGGQEYTNTQVTVKNAAGKVVAQFSTAVDCAKYMTLSPDGNKGIFLNNTTTNPRSWCPGAIVPTRYFDVGSVYSGEQYKVTLSNPSPWVSGSAYVTSMSLIQQ